MWINWVFVVLVPGWTDIITDPVSAKVSRSRLFAAIGFFVAIWLVAVDGIAKIRLGKDLNEWSIGLLLANGLGLTALTLYNAQQNRKNVDPESGAALKDNPPEVDPSKLPG